MAQTDFGRAFEFIAFWATNRAETNGQRSCLSALLFCHSGGAQVALQRCPILRSSSRIVSPYSPFAKGTSLLCNIGDISTLPSHERFRRFASAKFKNAASPKGLAPLSPLPSRHRELFLAPNRAILMA